MPSLKTYRVLHLIKGLGRGGAERLLVEGLQYADTQRFNYSYGYFLPWKDAFVPAFAKWGSEVTCFECKRPACILLSAGRIAKFLREKRIDLVHCHLPLAGIAGRVAAKMTKIPLVYTEHNVMERYHRYTRFANLRTWKWQTKVIAVSHQVADSIRSNTNSSVPVQVIQNGIAVDVLKASADDRLSIRHQSGIPQEAPVVGTVAAFRAQKNLSGWIRAARIIKDRLPECHFILVGDGPLRQKLQEEASSLGLNGSMHFAGLQENVIPFYSAMDVFMSASFFEGLPLALLEAMGMRLAVVATRVGGVPEAVTDGLTGFLVEHPSPELLAGKAQILLQNDQLRRDFGRASRAVVEERFNMRRMSTEIEQLYLEILEGRTSVVDAGAVQPAQESTSIVH